MSGVHAKRQRNSDKASDLSSFVTGHNIPVDGGTKTGGGWFFAPTERRFVNRPKTL